MKMGFKELKKEVLQQAEKDAKKTVADAQKRRDEILREVAEETRQKEQKSDAEIARLTEMMQKRELSSSMIEAKKLSLLAKKELVEEVFERAKREIDKKMSSLERKNLINRLLKRAENEIAVAKVICNKNDSRLIKKYKTEIDDSMFGGIVAEDKSGDIKVDYSFDSIVEEIKNNELSKITGILFK